MIFRCVKWYQSRTSPACFTLVPMGDQPSTVKVALADLTAAMIALKQQMDTFAAAMMARTNNNRNNVNRKVKQSEARKHGASRWATDGSQQNLVFDPGIPVTTMSSGQRSFNYDRTRGRVLHKKSRLMHEHFILFISFVIKIGSTCFKIDFFLLFFRIK